MINVADFERVAAEKLDPGVLGYFAGGAGDELTLRENVAAWRRWRLRPRVLADVGDGRDLRPSCSAGGSRCRSWSRRSPTSAWSTPRARRQWRGPRRRRGPSMCLSTLATRRAPRGRRGGARRAALVPALLLPRRRGDAGADRRGGRLRLRGDRRHRRRRRAAATASATAAPASSFPRSSACPASKRRSARAGGDDRGDLRPDGPGPRLGRSSRSWSPSAGVPVLVKGVLTAEDAALAVEHGAAGVVVSNHGGRQLDRCVATADALAEVVEAVDGSGSGPGRRRHPPRRRRRDRARPRRRRGPGRPARALGPRRGRRGRRAAGARAAARGARADAGPLRLRVAGRARAVPTCGEHRPRPYIRSE